MRAFYAKSLRLGVTMVGSSQNLVRRSEIRILRPTVGKLGCLWLGIVLVPVALEAFKAPRQGLTKLKAVV